MSVHIRRMTPIELEGGERWHSLCASFLSIPFPTTLLSILVVFFLWFSQNLPALLEVEQGPDPSRSWPWPRYSSGLRLFIVKTHA